MKGRTWMMVGLLASFTGFAVLCVGGPGRLLPDPVRRFLRCYEASAEAPVKAGTVQRVLFSLTMTAHPQHHQVKKGPGTGPLQTKPATF
jgi:hypothetical protein